jgi:hypothetical protein
MYNLYNLRSQRKFFIEFHNTKSTVLWCFPTVPPHKSTTLETTCYQAEISCGMPAQDLRSKLALRKKQEGERAIAEADMALPESKWGPNPIPVSV